MKISFVLGHELPFPPAKGGGVNSLLLGICKGLAASGHVVTAYSPRVAGRPDRETLDGVRHVRVQGTGRRSKNIQNVIAGSPYALRVIKELEDCDVLSCHLLHGFLFAFTKKAKVVTHTIHRDPKKFLYLFSGMDRIYSASDAVTDDAGRIVPALKNKFKTVYNCVDFTGYPFPTPRKRDGLVRFLFVGRFSSDKGMETFVPAFCNALATNPNIRFRALGPLTSEGGGDEMLVKRMNDYVMEQGLSDKIELCPPIFDRQKLDAAIKECDVIVLPSIGGETLNMSILESMRLGKALLISSLTANSPLNVDNKTGFFVKAGNAEEWTNKIIDIASDISRIEQFGKNVYEYGKERFSVKQIAADYVNDFENLIKIKTT